MEKSKGGAKVELIVLSGKGGTGKTTISAALSELAKDVVRIDCDVDAPNFSLYYKGKDLEKKHFYGGKKAFINPICVVPVVIVNLFADLML